MAVFSSRYARALADVLLEQKADLKQADQQLADFKATFDGSKDLREVLENPAIAADQKVALLDKMNARMGLSQPVRNFLAVLITHDRIASLAEVLAEYRKEIDARTGVVEAKITTARTLAEDERRNLESQIGKLAGAQVSASYNEDKALLGGAVVRIGSTVYDGSLRGKLNVLKEALIAG